MTDRRREHRRPDREAIIEQALDASGAGTWWWDLATNASFWDARYHAMYAFPSSAHSSYENWLSRVHPDDREAIRARVERLLQPGADSAWNEQFRVLHPEKGVRWMLGIGAVERDAEGRALSFRGVNLDVTERKQGEEVLRKNLERSEEIAHLGHWTWRVVDNHLAWSRGVYLIFGFDPESAPGMDALARAVHPDDRLRLVRFGELLVSGQVPNDVVECRIVAADGTTRYIHGTITGCMRDDAGTITQLSGIVHDITARKSAEAETRRIGDEERQRIAAELHDGVLQELAGIAYLTASVRAGLETDPQHGLASRVRRIEAAIVQAIDHTRQLACAVDPMLPGGDGLMGALRKFAATIEETYAIRCVLEQPRGLLATEDPVIANQLYRIAQEAIRNAVRHGKAEHVTVQLREDDALIHLSVLDDGTGIPHDALESAGMGLHVMRYRAGLIGGDLTIRKRADGGTEVTCRCVRPARAP